MFDPMRMLELFDEDEATIRAALATLDNFIAVQPPSSNEHAVACRQRRSLGQELEERGASMAVIAPYPSFIADLPLPPVMPELRRGGSRTAMVLSAKK